MMNCRMLVVLFAAVSLTLGTACGDDSSEGNNSNNTSNNTNNSADAGNNGGADVQQAQLPESWEYESEYHLRFTSFQFNPGTTGSDLNTLLRTNITKQEKKYPIVVLVHLKDIDTDAGTLAIRGGAGKKVDLQCDPELDGECEYQWDEDTAETYTEGVPLDTTTGEFVAELESLDFIATFELDGEEQDTVIPVTDLTLTARFPHAYEDEDGEVVVEAAIMDADLEGYLTKENADASGVQVTPGQDPIPLTDILGGEETLNADLDEDGTNDAWYLEGKFSAEPATVVTP